MSIKFVVDGSYLIWRNNYSVCDMGQYSLLNIEAGCSRAGFTVDTDIDQADSAYGFSFVYLGSNPRKARHLNLQNNVLIIRVKTERHILGRLLRKTWSMKLGRMNRRVRPSCAR